MTTRGRRAASLREDDLLSRLYQRIGDEHAARFAASYDLAAGLSRYQAWLDGCMAGEATEMSSAAMGLSPAARPGSASVRARTARAPVARVGPGAAVAYAHAEVGHLAALAVDPSAADRVVTELYQSQYRSLVRLAALLVRDLGTAEEVVQDSFVAMYAAWPRLASAERAESYLRQSVVNRCRSVLRHRAVVDGRSPAVAADLPSVLAGHERTALVSALRQLPARQREALVLRFYEDLSESQIAESMGISRRAVRLHTARAMSALRNALELDL